jgi:hypothetical protein
MGSRIDGSSDFTGLPPRGRKDPHSGAVLDLVLLDEAISLPEEADTDGAAALDLLLSSFLRILVAREIPREFDGAHLRMNSSRDSKEEAVCSTSGGAALVSLSTIGNSSEDATL